MNKILEILNNRVTYITLIFGAFGGALSLLLKIEELKTYYPSLSILIALLVSLLVSLLIKGKRGPKVRNRFKIAALVLFVLFLICAIQHTRYIINKSFEYHEFDETNRYVKGIYSDSGLATKKRYPSLNDEQILYQKMGGADGIKIFWTPVSVDNNIFLLVVSYCGIVLFFVASITFFLELLAEEEMKPKRMPKGTIIPQ
jgi:hypothetical protein